VLILTGGKDKKHWAEGRRRDGQWIIDNTSKWAAGVTVNNPECFKSNLLQQYLVDNLSKEDSTEYLTRCRGIADNQLVQAIWDYTHGYPLALSTAADLIGEAGNQARAE